MNTFVSTGTYVQPPPILFFLYYTCPLHTNSGCGKREAHNNRSMVKPEKAATIAPTTLIEDYLPCAGGPSVVNAICTQLHDLMKSGLTRFSRRSGSMC